MTLGTGGGGGAPLTAAGVKALWIKRQPWRHADGGGLYLVVTGPKRAWWMLHYVQCRATIWVRRRGDQDENW